MASQTKSSVFAIKKETTEGELIQPTSGSEFTALRDGFAFESGVETVDSDELVNDIGASKGFLSKETPTGSIPKYFKHSGIEGQSPDYGLMIESAIGSETVNSTEYDTVAGSTAGDSSTAAALNLDTGEGAAIAAGQAFLIKDGTNGYSIRNAKSIAGDAVTLNWNLSNAPASGVNLGKAIHYAPVATGHPTYSAHLWQAGSGSAYQQSMAGCRTTSMSMEFPANDLAVINFDFEGIKFYMNPVEITSSNEDIDFTVTSGAKVATLDNKAYKSPKEFARAVETKMQAVNDDGTITCSWDDVSGKYTIASDGAVLELDWASGPNTATSAKAKLGFDSVDLDSALTYTSDNEADYDSPVTPAFDDSDPTIVRSNELFLGGFDRNVCVDGNSVTVAVGTPKTDVESYCAESGISESVVAERQVTLSATLILKKHEIREFDTFINNGTTQAMFNHGPKSGGNWVAGKCVNVWMENGSITSHTIADGDGFQVVEIEIKGFVTSTGKDVHINLV